MDVVTVNAQNTTDQSVYMYIDNGRYEHGKVTPDPMLLENDQPAPAGLIIPAKGSKTFGNCLGAGDFPTVHAYKIKPDGKHVDDKTHVNHRFSPGDYATIPFKLEVVYDGSVRKA